MAGARVECAAGVNDAAAVPLHREHVPRAAAHRSARTCRRRPWNARRRRRRDHLAGAHHQQAVGDELVQRYRAHCPFRRPQAVRHRQGAGRRGGGYRHAAVARSLRRRPAARTLPAARPHSVVVPGRSPRRPPALGPEGFGTVQLVADRWAVSAATVFTVLLVELVPRGVQPAQGGNPRPPRRAGSSAREGGVRGEARQMGRGGPMADPTSLGGALRAAARPAPSPPRPPSPAGRPACAAPRLRRPR